MSEWREGVGYTLETTDFKGVPMRSNLIDFALVTAGDRTVVHQSMRYQMKGGVLAPLFELVAKRMMRKALRGALASLKEYVE